MSPTSLATEGLVDFVAQCIGRCGVNPRRLGIEITEHVMLHESEYTVPILRRLETMGVEVGLDNFGTGVTPLFTVNRVPVNFVKLGKASSMVFPATLTTAPSSNRS